jgi:OTU domain-containing protein 6
MAELEAMRKEAGEEAKTMVNWKEKENEAIAVIASGMQRKVGEVAADGHCLYYSIARQLKNLNHESDFSFRDLRKLAADYIRQHQEDFLPFLVNKYGDLLSQEEFEQYCNECENGAVWGGQNEVNEQF